MPDQTHNFLINYETTGADRVVADNERIARSQRRLIEAQGRLTTIGRMDISGLPISGRIQQQTEQLRELAMAQYQLQMDPVTTERMIPPIPADVAESIEVTTRGFRELGTTIEQVGPIQDAETQRKLVMRDALSHTTSATRDVERGFREMKETMIGMGESSHTTAAGAGELAEGIDETGKAAQKSGHWLGRYIQRYLIRYLVVWQGMVALKAGIRDWTQAHKELDMSIFMLQTTMGMATIQAEQYMATMRKMGGIAGVPSTQMATGAMQLGPAVGMAGQFGQMAGMGGAEGIEFFRGIQQRHGLSAREMEELIPRMWAAFTESGEDIKTWLGHWQEMMNQFDAGSSALAKWSMDWELYEQTSMRTSDKVKTAWMDMLSVLGDTQAITDAGNAFTRWLDRFTGKMLYSELTEEERQEAVNRYYAETGRQAGGGGPFGEFWTWGARGGFGGGGADSDGRLTIDPSAISQGAGLTTWATNLAGGTMQQAEFERLRTRVETLQARWDEQGIIGTPTTQQYWIQDAMGGHLASIAADSEVIAIATSEMNERQKTAVYNWPGNVQGVMISLQSLATTQIQPRADEPTPWTFNPQPIDWSNPWSDPWRGYQHGGEVRETGPAIVHKGERVIPVGGAAMGGNLNLQSNLFVDGRLVARDVSRIQGDQLLQAQRASGGQIGALV